MKIIVKKEVVIVEKEEEEENEIKVNVYLIMGQINNKNQQKFHEE